MSRLGQAVELVGAVANLAGALVYQRQGHHLADECQYLRLALMDERQRVERLEQDLRDARLEMQHLRSQLS